MSKVGRVFIFDHPLIKHKVSVLRDKETTTKEFRELVTEITMLMVYEITKTLKLKEIDVETPIKNTKTQVLLNDKICVVPILRAGLGMVQGMINLLPNAIVGHIGLYRDPVTLKPVEYYSNLPEDASESDIFVLDPMLATGGSAAAAIEFLKNKGLTEMKIVCLIAVNEGITKVQREHPEVDIYCAALDEKLNDHAYIVPGLGDAGDRIFGTK